MRKTATLGAIEGLALETLLLAPVVVPALLWWTFARQGVLAQGDATLVGWVLLSGPLTAVPLLLFAAGARRLKLATLGLVQYLAPTIQLLLGVWVFHEPFDGAAPRRLRLHLGRAGPRQRRRAGPVAVAAGAAALRPTRLRGNPDGHRTARRR